MRITLDLIKRGFWFSLWSLFLYFVCKSPITVFLTDYLHVWYIYSGAISGAVITILMFLFAEFGIYKPTKKVAVL